MAVEITIRIRRIVVSAQITEWTLCHWLQNGSIKGVIGAASANECFRDHFPKSTPIEILKKSG